MNLPLVSFLRLSLNAFTLVALSSSALLAQAADAPAAKEKTNERMLEMKSMIDGVRIEVTLRGRKEAAKLKETALLRTIETKGWGNEDGSLWVFEHDGFPVAMVELFARSKSSRWGHTMLAVSSDNLTGKVGDQRWTPASGNGVLFKPLPKAGKPGAKPRSRTIQMRQHARQFTVQPGVSVPNDVIKYRLLPQPVHRYKGHDVEDGAVFAFVRGESNPEALLFVQSKDEKWEFGFLRCSSDPLVAKLDKREVWRPQQVGLGTPNGSFWVTYRQLLRE